MGRKYLHWGETREAPMPKLTPLNSFDEPLFPAAAKESPDEEAKMQRLIEESNQACEEASRKLMEKRMGKR
jgi:hypothetical protein